jgi:hypothetical protein
MLIPSSSAAETNKAICGEKTKIARYDDADNDTYSSKPMR